MSQNQGASQEAIQYHYDVGNDFYAPWLGPTMIYSAAIWPDDRRTPCSLEEAQHTKLDWHIEHAGLGRDGRLLDIGCGWGGTMRRAVDSAGIGEAVGLTLSDAQADWIRHHHADRPIAAHVQPWQAYRDPEPFDGIVSIGAFEHFARPEMDRAAKVAHYGEFFRFCADSLKPGGRLALQTIVWMNVAPADEVGNLPLHIFPESNLPHVAEVFEAAAPYFHPMAFHNRPRDYSRTLREWVRGIGEHRDALTAMTDAETVKRYRDGFSGFMVGFERGVIGLTRYGFLKR
ncbi:MAG: class I SAM-dependent methyltransferase [Alphaproteobacteria bacterium]|nr:class I SAM-dependent methyltransferase [Alphaproteobacteria bacterium]MCB9930013.1 class I SAM-dependent methyltransferase [Alphaproteobacteria bacterium]